MPTFNTWQLYSSSIQAPESTLQLHGTHEVVYKHQPYFVGGGGHGGVK